MQRDRLRDILNRARVDRITPGAQITYSDDAETWTQGFGRQTYDDASPIVTEETIYDIASITKMVTTTLALQLLDQGRLSLEDPMAKYLPDLRHPDLLAVTIRHLLTYTATSNTGKSPSKMSHDELRQIIEHMNDWPLLYPAGTTFIYSSLPTMWLGLVIERIYDDRLDRIMARELFEPLGMTATFFQPPVTPGAVAPTEIDDRGEVVAKPHDETAWVLEQDEIYLGHAGLFSTTTDLMKLLRLFMDEGVVGERRLLSAAMVRSSYADHQFPSVVPPNGLGWWLELDRYFDQPLGAKTYGMTGFTGGLVLIDPERNCAFAMLANRTYPERPLNTRAINDLRSAVAGVMLDPKR